MAGLFDAFDPTAPLPEEELAQQAGGTRPIMKGTLISFQYPRSLAVEPNRIHDRKPMVIVTDVMPPHFIRGVNIHYLTFPWIKWAIWNFGDNAGFSYSTHVKSYQYLAAAFRMYYIGGMKDTRRLDTQWLKKVLQEVHSFNPGEIEKIRASIEQQIKARLQAKAAELTSYDEWQKSLAQQQRQPGSKAPQGQQTITGGPTQGTIGPTEASPPGPLGPEMNI